MKIINFGSINIDIFFAVDHIVRPGETISAKSIEKRAGGKGLNQSIALAKNSDSVYHVGNIGIDGKFLAEYLENEKINTEFVRESKSLTGNALIQVDDKGENSIVLYKGANFDNDKDFVDRVFDHFDENDILVLQNEINMMDYIIDKAYEKGLKIVLNPSPITEEVKKFDYDKIDMLLLNEHESKAISGREGIDDNIRYFKETYPKLKLVITLGKEGSIYISEEEMIRQKAKKVKAVDSTGAGDTFTGYFVANFYQGKKVKDCLELATSASALSVTKKGASVSIPSLSEVEEETSKKF